MQVILSLISLCLLGVARAADVPPVLVKLNSLSSSIMSPMLLKQKNSRRRSFKLNMLVGHMEILGTINTSLFRIDCAAWHEVRWLELSDLLIFLWLMISCLDEISCVKKTSKILISHVSMNFIRKLTLAGVGVRVKHIGPIKAKVYSAAVYLDKGDFGCYMTIWQLPASDSKAPHFVHLISTYGRYNLSWQDWYSQSAGVSNAIPTRICLTRKSFNQLWVSWRCFVFCVDTD